MNEDEINRLELEAFAALRKAMGSPPGLARDEAFEEAKQMRTRAVELRGPQPPERPRVIPFVPPTRGR